MNKYLEALALSPTALTRADNNQLARWAIELINKYKQSAGDLGFPLPGLRDLYYEPLYYLSLPALVYKLLRQPMELEPSENYQEFLTALYHIAPLKLKQAWLKFELNDKPITQTIAFRHAHLMASQELAAMATETLPAEAAKRSYHFSHIKEADLNAHPGSDAEHPADPRAQITIGDLHGNALKLIHFLVYQNVISISSEHYKELKDIYYSLADLLDLEIINEESKDTIAAMLARFEVILKTEIRFNTIGLVRLIGDIFGDRGCCDYLTLKVLACLKKAQIPLKILMSNHDLVMIQYYESWVLEGGVEPCDSFIRMRQLIDFGLVSEAEIKEILHQCYVPALRLVDYSFSPDKSRISVFTHAPIQIETIAALARRLGTTLKTECIENFFGSLDEINFSFQVYAKTDLLWELFREAVIPSSINLTPYRTETDPFLTLVWNKDLFLQRLPAIEGIEPTLFHGHELGEDRVGFVNLDSYLGKELDCHSLSTVDPADLTPSFKKAMRYTIVYSKQCSGSEFLPKSLPALSHLSSTRRLSTASFFAQASAAVSLALATEMPTPMAAADAAVASLGDLRKMIP